MPWYFYTYLLILALSILAAVLRWKVLTTSLRIIAVLVVGTFIVELAGRWVLSQYGNNTSLYALFRFISFLLLTWSFYVELKKQKWLYVIPIFYIFHTINLIYFQKFSVVYDSYSMIIFLFLVSLLCLYYLRAILSFPVENSIIDYSLSLISIGYLLFAASSLSVFGTINLVKDPKFASAFPLFQTIRAASNHLLYLTFLLSFFGKKVPLTKIK